MNANFFFGSGYMSLFIGEHELYLNAELSPVVVLFEVGIEVMYSPSGHSRLAPTFDLICLSADTDDVQRRTQIVILSKDYFKLRSK